MEEIIKAEPNEELPSDGESTKSVKHYDDIKEEDTVSVTDEFVDENGKIWDRNKDGSNNSFPDCVKLESEEENRVEKKNMGGKKGKNITKKESQKGRYKCDKCDYTNRLQSQVTYHVQSVHEKLKKYKCHLCDYGRNSRSALKYHINIVHEKERQYKCNQCDFAAAWKQTLGIHIKSIHEKKKPYKCHLCDFATSYQYSCKMHIKRVHEGIKNDKPDVGAFANEWRQKLKDLHPEMNNYKCTLCDFEDNDEDNLRIHIDCMHTE